MIDRKRAAAIRRTGLTPNADDPSFARLCRIARAVLKADTVLFSVVETQRQFFPAHDGLAEPYATTGETPLSHSFCQYVVRDEAPFVVPDSSSEPLVVDNPARIDLNIASYLGVPVYDENGVAIGALCATGSEPRLWTPDEEATLVDVAASIESELRLRSTTRRLEWRAQEDRVTREYEEALSQLSIATNKLQTVQAVSDEIAERVAPAIGAELTWIAVVEQDHLHFTHPSAVDERVVEAWQTAPLDAEIPMAEAVRTGRTVHLADRDSFGAHRDFATVANALDLQSFRAIPFGDEALGMFGALGVGWSQPVADDEVPLALTRIVELAETTLTRAWQFEIERSQARILERVVLPTTLPDTTTYGIAGCYIAPDANQRVGGDVYDVVVRPDGAIGVMIADAVGHDLTATRAAARLRHAVGVLTMEGYTPAAVLGAVNRYVASSSSRRLVTCVCLLFASDGSSVTIANAGHPQPVLRSAEGAAFVGPVGEMLLGHGALEYSEETVPLDDGDFVLCFTDGLIDRRDRSFVDSETWLLDFVAKRTSHDPHDVTDDLEAEIDGWSLDDDVAFLVVSRRTSLDLPQLRWTRPAREIRLAAVRAELSQWLDDVSLTPDHDLLLVVTELVMNAREASDPDDDVMFSVRLADRRDARRQVRLEVTNRMVLFEPPTEMPSPESIRGRGLAIVEALSHTVDIDIDEDDDSVTVTAVVGVEEED